MATEVVRDLADTIIGNKDTVEAMELDLESNPSTATVLLVDDIPVAGFDKFNSEDPSSYTLTCESGYSRDVERWMRGDVSPARAPLSAPALERDRTIFTLLQQNSKPLPSQPQEMTQSLYCGLWYFAAAVALPFASLTDSIPPDWISWCQESEAAGRVWAKHVSSVLRVDLLFAKLEAAFSQASCLCSAMQCRVRRIAEEQALKDMFAAAMDAVLVAYAVGFLLLSLCQASIIGF